MRTDANGVIRKRARVRGGACPWGHKPEVVTQSYFEMFVEENHIPESEWTTSTRVREFARKYHNMHYIPEEILCAFRIKVL